MKLALISLAPLKSAPVRTGGPLGYFYDRESGEFTIYHLKGFLRALASCPNLERIHLIAHSRGADICTAALRELLIEKGPEGIQKLKVHNLVLAAPDIDQDVIFQRLVAERIGFCAKRLTLYVSPDDVIIGASNWLYSGKRRVGQMSPEDFTEKMRTLMGVVNQVHIIDSEVSPFLLHGYYYDNPEVSSDLILLLRDDRDPGEEHGRPLEMIDVNYWKIPEGYPNQEVEES